jgi:UDP-glucose 4-epimerase
MSTLSDKTVLITGGTGSFGNELLRHVIADDLREIRIFSRDELKQEMMRLSLKNPRVRFYIGDVRDRASVDAAMAGVDLVFHAAALKQVPSCEFFPMQAVMTNVDGSNNVIESAIAHGVGKVVCLSTDKGVYPINAMGMSKALMEKVALSAARRVGSAATNVCVVRYGNVMCSRGSVIPLFIRQIKAAKPVSVTVPEMTRFLLRLSDAIALVLFAFDHARGGDILVRKSPACTVADLSEALQQVFQRRVGTQVIGIRHGEKIYETLVTREELGHADDMGEYYRVTMDDRDLNYDTFFTKGERERETAVDDYTSHNTERLSVERVKELLLSLPEVRAELSS